MLPNTSIWFCLYILFLPFYFSAFYIIKRHCMEITIAPNVSTNKRLLTTQHGGVHPTLFPPPCSPDHQAHPSRDLQIVPPSCLKALVGSPHPDTLTNRPPVRHAPETGRQALGRLCSLCRDLPQARLPSRPHPTQCHSLLRWQTRWHPMLQAPRPLIQQHHECQIQPRVVPHGSHARCRAHLPDLV